MFIRLLASAGLIAWSAGAAARDEVRQPTSKWLVEFADNECLLSRSYGTDAKQLLLTFERIPMNEGVTIYILKTSNRADLNNGSGRVSFGTAAVPEAKFGAYLIRSKGLRRISVTVPDESYKAAALTETISVAVRGEVEETFVLPGFASALQVLEQCAVDLGEHWGISADEQRRLSKPAKSLKPLSSYFSPNDYPTTALRQEASGRTEVRLIIDRTGRPVDCILMRRSGNQAIDSETCQVLLDRARFEPAKDVDGKPMKSLYVTTVNWLLQ